MNGLDDSSNKEKGAARDDKIHGSLLVLNELLRVSNTNWERQNDSLMQRLQWDQNNTNAVRLINTLYKLPAIFLQLKKCFKKLIIHFIELSLYLFVLSNMP